MSRTRQFACTPCYLEGRLVRAHDMVGMQSVCLDHAMSEWLLCRRCGYWVATNGDLCEACAVAP
jgi:hypothetical protein